MKIHREFQPTGNSVADLVSGAVGHYRKIGKPLRTIYLHSYLYNMWEMFIYKNYKEQGKASEFDELREQGQMFQFDGVNIDRASRFQTSNLAFDFYE